jgi:uncharacterized protein YkwD
VKTRRLPVIATGVILAGMHKPIRAAVLAVLPILLSLANPAAGAHAARPDTLDRIGVASAVAAPSPSAPVGYAYTVQPADTLWDIAVAHGITVNALLAANDLADPRWLRPGQSLFVPAPPPTTKRHPASTVSEGVRAVTPVVEPATALATEAEAIPGTEAGAAAIPTEKATWPAELLSLINDGRVAAGLPPLIWSPELASASQAHAEDCARRDRGSHVGSDGALLDTRIERTGSQPRWASENWAYAQTVQHAFLLWWSEEPGRDPHRRNILDPRYSEVGIGVAAARWGTYFVADFAGK